MTDVFTLRDNTLYIEHVSLAEVEKTFGTPTYVYSRAAMTAAFRQYALALASRPALICYAMKANSNLAVLDVLAREGAGFDIVSGGELARALAVGVDPKKIVFSGVAKKVVEIDQALKAGIGCFNIESETELDRVASVAQRMSRRAPISIRVNPDVDAKTHPYISTGLKNNKFGVAHARTLALYERAATMPSIEIVGIDCHIGSQITEIAPYLEAVDRVLDLVDQLATMKIELRHVDLGGGLGITYRDENPPSIAEFVGAIVDRVQARAHGGKTLMFEPGRSIVGNAGVLLARVELIKHSDAKNFAIVDAAMNDLVRPAMYDAWMDVRPVSPRTDVAPIDFDIVGPVCESGDWLARDRRLALAPGDLIAIMSAGAYGMSMASNYNTRGRAAEVMVDGDRMHLVRQRETVESLFALESILPR